VRLALTLHGGGADLMVDGRNIAVWTMEDFMTFYNVTMLNPAVHRVNGPPPADLRTPRFWHARRGPSARLERVC
jgi:hypothetical protein